MCDESARASSDARVAVERQKEIRNSLGYHNLSYLVVYTFRDETVWPLRKTFGSKLRMGIRRKGLRMKGFECICGEVKILW